MTTNEKWFVAFVIFVAFTWGKSLRQAPIETIKEVPKEVIVEVPKEVIKEVEIIKEVQEQCKGNWQELSTLDERIFKEYSNHAFAVAKMFEQLQKGNDQAINQYIITTDDITQNVKRIMAERVILIDKLKNGK